MKLSVLMITYNHERFIAQALDSILMQEVDFEYEIVIGEDCSSDKTREIVCRYQTMYPDKIRLLLNDVNLGMMENFQRAYLACQGDFIAILEGDDFWTNAGKLQRQVDLLEANPNLAICFHNAEYLWEIEGEPPTRFLCKQDQKETSTLEDVLAENFIPTLTSMFRNRLFGDFPQWFAGLKFGDWPLHVLNAQYGDVGYLNESMASYRVHSAGAASTAHSDKKKDRENIQAIIDCYKTFDAYFDRRYRSIIAANLAQHYCLLAKGYEGAGELLKAFLCYARCLSLSSASDVMRRITGRLGRMAAP
jgi:glycosyltransferase involved in cell wall biosynthesis